MGADYADPLASGRAGLSVIVVLRDSTGGISTGSPFALLEQLICALLCSLLQKAAASRTRAKAEDAWRRKTDGLLSTVHQQFK